MQAIKEEICGIVAGNQIMKDLSPGECRQFVELGWQHTVDKDTYFFHQGEQAEHFYIVIEGQVKLSQITPSGQEIILQIIGPGGGIGIIVALGEMKYPASAKALVDCRAYTWDRETTRQLMHKIPQLAINALELVSRRFANLQTRYQELATSRVEQRVAITILRLARQFGKREEAGLLIDMSLSRQELAEMTGTNLYNVSRIMSKWEQDGIVSLGRKSVMITDAHRLVMISEGTS